MARLPLPLDRVLRRMSAKVGGPAARFREGAPPMKRAALLRRGRVAGFIRRTGRRRAALGIGLGHRIEQRDRVRMARGAEQNLARLSFRNLDPFRLAGPQVRGVADLQSDVRRVDGEKRFDVVAGDQSHENHARGVVRPDAFGPDLNLGAVSAAVRNF